MMRYGKYQFVCRLESDALLPDYKGSTFRGALGLSLKHVVCALKRQECPQCLLKQNCIYPAIFEPRLTADFISPGMIAPPHPYVIEPPSTTKTRFPRRISP